MSQELLKDINRAEAEESVKKRLNFSKRFTRGMFGLGLASGFTMALLPSGQLWPDRIELAELAVLATTVPIERFQARRTADKIVADFARANAPYDNEPTLTVPDFEDTVTRGRNSKSNLSEVYDDMKEALTPAALNLAGSIGAFMLTSEIVGNAQPVSHTAFRIGGVAIVAVAASAVNVVDGISIDQKLSSSLHMIESIERSHRLTGNAR